MSRTSKALKRLGVGSVTIGTVFAMPYVGVATAFAATPTDPVVTITSQQTNSASPRNDGTDTTVKVSANVVYTPSSTASDNTNAPAGVKFSYTPTGGLPVVIGTDATFPYSIAWTPPTGGGAFTLTAQAVLANGTATGTAGTRPTSVVDAPAVHISSPAEGGSIGAYGGVIAVSGTRSADFPALSVKAATRDNSTGVLSAYGTPTVVAATTGGANWNAAVAVPACTAVAPATCDVVIYAATTTAGAASDEVTEAAEYAQTLTSSTVAPATATVPSGSSQTYTDTVLDQNGKPVAGLTVGGTSSNHAVAADPGTTTTNGLGVATFAVATSPPPATGTTTLTFQTQTVVGTYNPQVDFSRTATLTTYTSTPTSVTLTASPSKSLYAEQTEYPPLSPSGTGFPIVKFCVIDQNGNSTPAGTGQAPVLSDSRRDSTPAGTAGPLPEAVTFAAIAGTGCYQLGLPAATGTFGTDTITGYFEQNGTPGQQAGEPSATPLVLNYGNLAVTGLDTQAQKGTAVTVSFKVLDPSGRPFANRALTLTTSAAGTFSATQPAGTSATPPTGSNGVAVANTLFGTTDATGVVSATVNSATVQTVTVTATDNLNTASQLATGMSGPAAVDFRNLSVALTQLTLTNAGTIVQPAASTTAGTVRPGDVVDGTTFVLKDANNAILKNVSVAVSLDHGFFVGSTSPACAAATPNPERYTNCPFVTPPADGAATGPIKAATTTTLTSDANGLITFADSIGRDAGFDDDGLVLAKLTATANGGTQAANAVQYSTIGMPINGGSVKLVPASPTTALSGDVQAQTGSQLGSNPAQVNTVQFAIHVLDQYGNLVKLPTNAVSLTVTGGTLNGAAATTGTGAGSFTGNETVYSLQSATTSTTGLAAKVTASWDAPVTNFKGTTTGVAPNTTTTYTTVPGTAVTKTDTFTVNFYAIDLKNLAYSFTTTPGNTEPVNTAVTTSVTVKDQKANPVSGLFVQFVRSGPNDAAGNSQTGGSTNQITNAQGRAGTSYSSGTPGVATVTVIVTDGSGNELSRGVQNVTFTKGTPTTGLPTISISTTAINVGQSAIVTVRGKAGTSIQLYALTRPATAYQVVRTATIPASGVYTTAIRPRGNTRLFARSAAGDSGTVAVSVRPAMSLVGSASGKTGTFTGTIVPGHGNVAVRIFTVKNGAITLVGTTRTAANGHYSFSRTFAATGAVTFIAQTLSDGQNLSTQSNRVTVTFK
jgi:hypothetical protein